MCMNTIITRKYTIFSLENDKNSSKRKIENCIIHF